MLKTGLQDTIVAISTSSIGESGIGIVRLSGRDALSVADRLFLSKDKNKPSSFDSHTVHYGWVVDEAKKVIDEVILTVMRKPKTYTKEDIVEINCHGGIIPLRATLELALKKGCRLAEPGEFTKRAFLNGRIDLAQAEAVLDIIKSKTDRALKMGVDNLKGALSKEANKIRRVILDLLVILEANIDFPEDEISPADLESIRNGLDGINNTLREIRDNSQRAKLFREGVSAVICGKPNVGKSSLLNALLRQERSIVTSVAGTTRDTIEEIIDIKGIPVRIVDTAGIIEPRDLIEKKAVERSKKYIDSADLVILLFDGSRRLGPEDILLMKKLKNKTAIAIINKIDLKQNINKELLARNFKRVVEISAKKAKNINLLEEAIVNSVYRGEVKSGEPVMVSNLRQLEIINKAQKLIAEAAKSLDNKLSPEFVAQDLKDALSNLDDLLGKRFSEDLLDRIFLNFCIGK